MIDTLVSLCHYLEVNSIFHGNLHPKNIFVTNEGKLMLSDNGLFDEFKLNYTRSFVKREKTFLTPFLLASIKDGIFDPIYDKFKADVFSLGMCLVYICNLTDPFIEGYDYKLFEINEEFFNNQLNFIGNKYSPSLENVIRKMIEPFENNRINFNELKEILDPNSDKKTIKKNELISENKYKDAFIQKTYREEDDRNILNDSIPKFSHINNNNFNNPTFTANFNGFQERSNKFAPNFQNSENFNQRSMSSFTQNQKVPIQNIESKIVRNDSMRFRANLSQNTNFSPNYNNSQSILNKQIPINSPLNSQILKLNNSLSHSIHNKNSSGIINNNYKILQSQGQLKPFHLTPQNNRNIIRENNNYSKNNDLKFNNNVSPKTFQNNYHKNYSSNINFENRRINNYSSYHSENNTNRESPNSKLINKSNYDKIKKTIDQEVEEALRKTKETLEKRSYY